MVQKGWCYLAGGMLSEEEVTSDPYLNDISEAEKLKRVGTDLYRREMLEDG